MRRKVNERHKRCHSLIEPQPLEFTHTVLRFITVVV